MLAGVELELYIHEHMYAQGNLGRCAHTDFDAATYLCEHTYVDVILAASLAILTMAALHTHTATTRV